jgi:hypothetical protein
LLLDQHDGVTMVRLFQTGMTRYILPSLAFLLLLIAAGGWFSYMAYGIAHGAIVGIPGRERDLQQLAHRASLALTTAVSCEALAVGTVSWVLIAKNEPTWIRLCVGCTFAAMADLFTFVVLRPI